MAIVALGGFDVMSSSDRLPAFVDSVRACNRRWFNPVILRIAGSPPWGVARFEHRGRRSRMLRATPLMAWPVSGGFLMLMPYGTDVDWAKNLLHDGAGVLQRQGVRYRVGQPRIVPTKDALPALPLPIGRLVALFGSRHVMRVDVLESPTAEVSLPA